MQDKSSSFFHRHRMKLVYEHSSTSELDDIKAFLQHTKVDIKDDRFIQSFKSFLTQVRMTVNYFNEWVKEGDNKKISAEFDRNVKRLQKIVGQDVNNISAITIHGKGRRGSVTFNNDFFGSTFIGSIFLKKPFPLTTGDDPGEKIKYLKKPFQLVLPVEPLQVPHSDQLFSTIIIRSLPLAQIYYDSLKGKEKRKVSAQRFIMAILQEFKPEVCTKKDHAETKLFKRYLYPKLK